MRKVNKIIIHCADTPDDKDFTVADINQWHIERGFEGGCGYHKVIRRDGIIETGRDDEIQGIHASTDNLYSIGICLIGRNQFTDKQWLSLRKLVDSYLEKYKEFNPIVMGHCDSAYANGKTCPNFNVAKWFWENKIVYKDTCEF